MVRDEKDNDCEHVASMITKTRTSDYLVGDDDDDENSGHVRVH